VEGTEVVGEAAGPYAFHLDALPSCGHHDRSGLAPGRGSVRVQPKVAETVRAGEEEPGQIRVERSRYRLVGEAISTVLVDIGESIRAELRVPLVEEVCRAPAVSLVCSEHAEQ
jgi:hypothetical protein